MVELVVVCPECGFKFFKRRSVTMICPMCECHRFVGEQTDGGSF